MAQKIENLAISAHQRCFHKHPSAIISAPGRINLIGEHTDYSEGFVLPVAIDRNVTISFSPRKDDIVHIYSKDFDAEIRLRLSDLARNTGGWVDYVMGMAWALIEAGFQLSGWEGVITGNIPIGAGLSSSAALEVATGKAFCLSSGFDLSPTQLALISRKAESDWVGVNVGIMDQLISAAGKENHAILLDCRSLNYEYVPIPDQISLVVLDTMTRRELTQTEYNTRHQEVNQAAKILGIEYLRDATLDMLQEKKAQLTPKLFQRGKHVINENQRVEKFSYAMRNGDLLSMGALINASHNSLRDDFEVSSRELDLIVNLAQNQPNCLGARMMGAGFGGCALALLSNGDVKRFSRDIYQGYLAETNIEPHIFSVQSSDGVHSFSIKNNPY
jgi:galactokinase